MDFSPAEGSTSHILLLSDSVVQPSNLNSDTDISTDTSIATPPQESGTPTGSVVVNSRDRSGTIIARPIWDPHTHHYWRRSKPHYNYRSSIPNYNNLHLSITPSLGATS